MRYTSWKSLIHRIESREVLEHFQSFPVIQHFWNGKRNPLSLWHPLIPGPLAKLVNLRLPHLSAGKYYSMVDARFWKMSLSAFIRATWDFKLFLVPKAMLLTYCGENTVLMGWGFLYSSEVELCTRKCYLVLCLLSEFYSVLPLSHFSCLCCDCIWK